jgi:glycosyltransferase involved in cell wall biosynthesis
LASFYRSADVLLATSMGEGFGIPVVEAQGCGTPVIVSDFSAQPELVGAGWKVGGQPWWDEAQESILFTPAISAIVNRLKDAYAARGDNGLRERAVAKAAEYDTDKVFAERWVPLLVEMEKALAAPAPPLNRAERRRLKKAGKAA